MDINKSSSNKIKVFHFNSNCDFSLTTLLLSNHISIFQTSKLIKEIIIFIDNSTFCKPYNNISIIYNSQLCLPPQILHLFKVHKSHFQLLNL